MTRSPHNDYHFLGGGRLGGGRHQPPSKKKTAADLKVCVQHAFSPAWKKKGFKWCIRLYVTSIMACNGSTSSLYWRRWANPLSVAAPPASICKWLSAVMAAVRFHLAQSSCLISAVISRTMLSLRSAFLLISATWILMIIKICIYFFSCDWIKLWLT